MDRLNDRGCVISLCQYQDQAVIGRLAETASLEVRKLMQEQYPTLRWRGYVVDPIGGVREWGLGP